MEDTNTMDIDNADANKSTEEDFLSDKVIFGTYTFLQRHALDSWHIFLFCVAG